jgi:hypothetical protein
MGTRTLRNDQFYLTSFIGQVLMPNGAYKGQKLTILVKTKTADRTIKTIPSVPVITLVKNKIAKITATTTLIIRSAEPMFFFMMV